MPYKVIARGDKFAVVNKDTGHVKGMHDSKEKAMSQMRLLYGIEHGMVPRSKGRKKRKD